MMLCDYFNPNKRVAILGKFVFFVALLGTIVEACDCAASSSSVVQEYIERGPQDHFYGKDKKPVLGAEETSLIVSESAKIDITQSIRAHGENV